MASILGESQAVDVRPMIVYWRSPILRLQLSIDMDPRSVSSLYRQIAPPPDHDTFVKRKRGGSRRLLRASPISTPL